MNEPLSFLKGFPDGSDNKESACSVRDQVQSLGWEDPLEKEMATHSSILAWRIPLTEDRSGHRSWAHKESDTTKRLTNIHTFSKKNQLKSYLLHESFPYCLFTVDQNELC